MPPQTLYNTQALFSLTEETGLYLHLFPLQNRVGWLEPCRFSCASAQSACGKGLHPDSGCSAPWQPGSRCLRGNWWWPNSDTRRNYSLLQAFSGGSGVLHRYRPPPPFREPWKFWCSDRCVLPRCTKRRRPSMCECNCWLNLRTAPLPAWKEPSCQVPQYSSGSEGGLHPIFGDGVEVLLVGTQGFVLYASGSSQREKKKIKILGNRGFLNISHGNSCHNDTSWMTQICRVFKRSKNPSEKAAENKKVLKTHGFQHFWWR